MPRGEGATGFAVLLLTRFVLMVAVVIPLVLVPVAAADPAAYVRPFSGTASGAKDFGTGGGAGNAFNGVPGWLAELQRVYFTSCSMSDPPETSTARTSCPLPLA